MDVPKTIRDSIQQSSRWPKWIGICAGISVGIIGGLLRTTRAIPANIRPFLALGILLVFVIALVFSKRLGKGVTCPKCAAPLGAFAFMMQDTSKRKKINFCPYCAVSLDDPMPEAPTPAENVTTPDKLVWK